ncbi:hypothetical protein CSC2_22770 [Clostridium zeae]|uniref:Tail spike domain-containing protein n=1 Tax=Clostridium zeae TaxID=2759022 RepID=A0ABQ1EAH2_9CLOT|nr:hypothetical protein CSC2_22770 [Clostridium zeae]
MKDHAESPVRFNFYSDIDKIGTAYYIRKNFLDAIMGDDDNSFLKIWGGELDRRIDSIGIYKQLGTDRGFKVAEGENLITIEESTEGTEVTRSMVTGRDENDNVLELPEKYVDSPLINNYPQISFKHIDFPNIKVSRDDAVTEYADKEAVYTELRRQAALLYNEQHIDRPSVNFSIEFDDLSKTDEYKEIKALQQLYLGDIVTIHSSKLGIDIKARLISYTYDCVLEKYTKLELGDYVKSEYTVSNILNNRIATVATDNYVIGNKIKEALGGHVVKREGEILIMDKDDIATATKVWRYNLNGLGYSSTGYNGDYNVAITMDGEIVANFIKTGELDASLIKVGVLKSENQITWINMNDGTFNFANKFKYDGHTFYFDGDLITDLDGSVITGKIKSIDGTIDIDLSNGGFRIGGRSGDTAIHTNSYSRWNHSNGSYSVADGNGFMNYNGSTGRSYHYLFHADTLNFEGSTITVQLPDEFKNKDFVVTPFWIEPDNGTLYLDSAYSLHNFGITFENSYIYVNKATATFFLYAHSTWVQRDLSNNMSFAYGYPRIWYIVTA